MGIRFSIYVIICMLMWNFRMYAQTGLRAPGFAESLGWSRTDTMVTIPASLRELPDYAFADLADLKEVRFEEGSRLKTVGEHAFLGCESLQRISLPPGVEKLGTGCFRECKSLKNMKVPERVREIPGMAFRECSALERVDLPCGLQDIKQFAFIYCESLDSLKLPSGLVHIGNNAFSRCVSLTSVSIPDKVTEIESYAFSDCHGLREARLPANGHLLGELLFNSCDNLILLEEPSPDVPRFDCNSFIFDPLDEEAYGRCRLKVPEEKRDAYASAPGWSLFFQ
ncbi:MAG: leucine-rich repeat domain-containing protein [Muribaculum sp.]|nr:leucine-rich repeat domain-containing protein [Muribaculum sp.]